MTEFQELIQDAPNFASMERGELVAYAYGMFAAGTKANSDNAKLRKLAARMAEALGIDCEWTDPNWCKSPCVLEFGCWPIEEHTEIQCPAWAAMHELGVEEQ